MITGPWTIAVFALVMRLVVIALTFGTSSPEPFEYEDLARHLLTGEGFTTTYRETTYHSLHSALPYVTLNVLVCGATNHRHLFLLLAQSVLTGLLVVVIFRIAETIFDTKAATIAALLTAAHPGLIVYDTRKLHPLSLDALVIAGAVLFLMSLDSDASVVRRLVAGAVLALGMFERGTLVVFATVAPLWMACAVRPAWSGAVRFALPIFCGLALTFGPWVARNYAIHHTIVVMTTSGEHFWRGNHPGATGTSYAIDGRDTFAASDDEALKMRVASADELGQMRAFTDASRRFWLTTPAAAITLYARKLFYFFAVTPTAGLLYPRWELFVYLGYYLVCMLAAVLGLRALASAPTSGDRWSAPRWLPLFCIVSVAVVQSAFYIETRHRWGVEPLLLIFTAKGLCDVVGFLGSTSPPACSEGNSQACSPSVS